VPNRLDTADSLDVTDGLDGSDTSFAAASLHPNVHNFNAG